MVNWNLGDIFQDLGKCTSRIRFTKILTIMGIASDREVKTILLTYYMYLDKGPNYWVLYFVYLYNVSNCTFLMISAL